MASTALIVVVEPGSYKVGDIQEGSVDTNKWEAGLGVGHREWISIELGNTAIMAL